jgi:hypothetical protein
VKDIRALKYENGNIYYKLSHGEELYKQLPSHSLNNNVDECNHDVQLHTNKLPISKTKHKHLMEMLSAISAEHHDFYKDIIFES